MRLTEHFTLEELTRSDTAIAKGISNVPDAAQLANLSRLAGMLERVRDVLGGAPMLISSGLRVPALNRAVGGVANSAHVTGLAADFTCPKFGTPQQICRALAASDIPFDQIIQEGTWVHFGLSAQDVTPRRQVLTADFSKGAATYKTGL